MSALGGLSIDTEVCTRLTVTLAHFLWQGAAVGLIAATLALALRRSAVAKYRIYAAALLTMAACPPATFRLLAPAAAAAIRVSGVDASARAPDASPADHRLAEPPARRPRSISVEPTGEKLTEPAHPSAAHLPPPPRFSWHRYAPAVAVGYALGVSLMLGRLLFALRGARRLCRQSEAIADPSVLERVARQARRLGLKVVPPVRRCRNVLVPTLAGVIRPVILLPVAVLAGLNPEQLEAIIAHELAHVRRRDPAVLLLQRLVEAVLFFHPAVWFVSRALHVEREHCCDDAVVHAAGRPVAYAESLLRVAELCLAQQTAAAQGVLLAAVDDRSTLERRVMRLLNDGRTPRLRLSRSGLVAVVTAALLLGAVAFRWRGNVAVAGAPASVAAHTGQLVDVEGRPVSNAYLVVDGQNLWSGVRSDASGGFTLSVPPSAPHQLVAWSQRSRRMGLAMIPAGASERLDPVRLEYAEANVDGRVVDASGNPVKGASVRLFVTDAGGSVFRFNAYRSTDDSGYYASSLVPTGPGLTLRATLSDDPADKNTTASVPLARQFQVELPDLVVRTTTAPSPKPGPQRVRYSGRVVDEGGAPVAGAEIELQYPKNHMIAGAGVVLSDAEGRFSRLLPPDAERVALRVTRAGFIGGEPERAATPAASALRDGSALIVLKAGLPLEGTVRDDAGAPVSNALVMADYARARTPGPLSEPIENAWTPRTTRDGGFRAEGLPRGSRQITVLADGFAPALVSVDVELGAPKLDVRLERGLTYAARVVDSDGKPIAGAYVGCDDWAVGEKHFDALVRHATCDGEGRFTLRDLPKQGTVAIMAGGGKLGFFVERNHLVGHRKES